MAQSILAVCQVRVSNLNELIYKNGQAGITKASVTLIFDNTDKSQSPHGYERYDEIHIQRQAGIPHSMRCAWPCIMPRFALAPAIRLVTCSVMCMCTRLCRVP